MSEPRILGRRAVFPTPWITVNEKVVDFGDARGVEKYYSLANKDYLAAFVLTTDRRAVMVRQYRPAVERFTYEIPAGLVEEGETPEQACRREIAEETGLALKELHSLGAFHPDTGRLENQQHAFFAIVEAGTPNPEPGITVELWTLPELYDALKTRRFDHVLHMAIVLYADRFLHAGKLFAPGP